MFSCWRIVSVAESMSLCSKLDRKHFLKVSAVMLPLAGPRRSPHFAAACFDLLLTAGEDLPRARNAVVIVTSSSVKAQCFTYPLTDGVFMMSRCPCLIRAWNLIALSGSNICDLPYLRQCFVKDYLLDLDYSAALKNLIY